MYFDRSGEPITFDRWAELKNRVGEYRPGGLVSNDYSRVALDEPGIGMTVSTVWLGIKHGADSDGRPLIFETMVFGGPWDQECRRYATEVEAICGHLTAVEQLAAGMDPWD